MEKQTKWYADEWGEGWGIFCNDNLSPELSSDDPFGVVQLLNERDALQSENDALRAQLADMKLKYNTLQVEFAALSSAAGHMEAAYEAALAAASS